MSTYEEVRDAMVDILSGREQVSERPEQWVVLQNEMALVLDRRAGRALSGPHGMSLASLSLEDAELARDVFWDLFRQGFITLGSDDSNPQWPFFRLSHFGQKALGRDRPFQFTDTGSYIAMVRRYAPMLDPVAQTYLEEAVATFYAGCYLASAVMLGMAAEKMFLDLLDVVLADPALTPRFQAVVRERHILPKMKRFLHDLDQLKASLPPGLMEELETQFAAMQTVLRRSRNDGGHLASAAVEREQGFVNLQLFPPFAQAVSELVALMK